LYPVADFKCAETAIPATIPMGTNVEILGRDYVSHYLNSSEYDKEIRRGNLDKTNARRGSQGGNTQGAVGDYAAIERAIGKVGKGQNREFAE
jgi:hypothetical protein